MSQQIYLFATVFLSVAVVFLFYQNVKMERRFNREMKSITDNMREMTQMIALNNDISTSKQPQSPSPTSQTDVTLTPGNTEHPEMVINELGETLNPDLLLAQPEVTPGLVNEMSSLMKDYSEFNEPQIVPEYTNVEENVIPEEKYDSISEELKREIEELEKRDSSSECVEDTPVEALQELNLEEMENQQVEGLVEEVPMEIENLEDPEEEPETLDQDEELDLEEIKTFDENALEELNPSGDYKNMVDDIIATASEAENNIETEETKASWDGSVDITEEGVFVELDNVKKSIDSLSVKELTYLCKMSGLKSKGKKAELISRFTDYSTQKKNTFFLESQ